MKRAAFELNGEKVLPGRKHTMEIPVARLPTGTWLSMPVTVFHGKTDGPQVWISAAIHGDELNGVEIVNSIMRGLDVKSLRGTVVAVPVVNVFGFVNQSRYLPDGRDLNRSFPGSKRGSLAARLADLFMRHIVEGSDVGMDFHTGTANRTNVPQIRADLEDKRTKRLAKVFGAPVMLHARTRDGSLREAAARKGITALLFEGGEALRFEDSVIAAGVDGALRVMGSLDMIDEVPRGRRTILTENARWIRARRAGLVRCRVGLGDRVEAGQVLATISDVRGGRSSSVKAPSDGIVVGMSKMPIVTQGDALFNVAEIRLRAPSASR